RTVGSETLDLRVDDPWVDLPDHVVAESQALDAPRRHVLDHDIRLHDQLPHYFLAALRLEIAYHAAFVGVHHDEIIGIEALPFGGCVTSAFPAGGFDLDHIRSQPGQRFRAGCAGFILRKVHDLQSGQ